MTASAAAEKFMHNAPQSAEALTWLEDRPQDEAAQWMKALRETGADAFAGTGLPTPKWEGWQHTNLRPLTSAKFRYAAPSVKFDAKKIPAPLFENSGRVVLVDGQLQNSLSSLPPHVEVMSLQEAAAKKMDGLEQYLVSIGDLAKAPFKALNSAYLRDGFVLTVATGKDIETPVEVVFYTQDGAASYPRVLYKLGENSGLTVIERHMGAGGYFANTHAEIVPERDSRLKFYRFLDESAEGNHISCTVLNLMKAAQFEGFSGVFGGALARQEVRIQLLESAVYASMGGTYILSGRQSHDFTILADHFEPDGKSVQNFRGVIDAQARAVYQGKIHVRRSAQKTDGYQSHHALLLSETAESCAKPELEIYADDVKCSHGATSGHLDEGALFYLRSRGIPEGEARSLLIESFLGQSLEAVSDLRVREIYRQRVADALQKGAS